MNIPEILYAGDQNVWTEPFPQDEEGNDLKASDGWTYKYRIINSAGLIQISSLDITSAADGDNHEFTLTAAQTAAWTPGKYLATGYLTKSGQSNQVVGRKQIEIIINVLTAQSFDFRSHARKTLDAIEAAIERRASKEQEQLSISTRGGSSRAIQFLSYEELLNAKNYYQTLVNQELAEENINNGLPSGNRLLVRFQ